MRRSFGDLGEVFPRSLRDLVHVLVRRSCGDPGKILSKRSLREDFAGALC